VPFREIFLQLDQLDLQPLQFLSVELFLILCDSSPGAVAGRPSLASPDGFALLSFFLVLAPFQNRCWFQPRRHRFNFF
jgi:hypothetical protein